MSIDFSGLGDLAKKPVAAKAGWEPLAPDRLGEGKVLFFDQSLTATGWVELSRTATDCAVLDCGTFKDQHSGEKNSIEVQLQRGVSVFERSYVLIEQALREGFDIAHESPPNPAQVKGGGYGSLLAAQSVRNAVSLAQGTILMLGAQPAKKLVCGNGNAKKPEAHAVLKETCFPWIDGSELVTNEATRDALMGALLWLYRRKM